MTQVTFTTNDKNILTKALKDKKNLRSHKRIQCVLFQIDGLIFRDTKAWIQKQNLQIFRRGHFEARNSDSKFENRKPEQDCSQKIDYPEQIFGKCEKEPKVRKGLPLDKNAV